MFDANEGANEFSARRYLLQGISHQLSKTEMSYAIYTKIIYKNIFSLKSTVKKTEYSASAEKQYFYKK